MKKLSKTASLLLVLFTYLAAFTACFFSYDFFLQLTGGVIPAFFLMDILATLIVWAAGLLVKNASLYDPYWSLTPIAAALFFTMKAAYFNVLTVLYISVFAVWGIRLTLNWIRDWPGLSHQDWRYTMLREKNPKIYFITNLFGINLIPTLVVFAALMPFFAAVQKAENINGLTAAGALICVLAALLQFIADEQMRKFRKGNNKGKNMDSGLWKYSRHPNYFGEISFWWGIYIMQLSVLPGYWFLIAGPLLMTLLFVFISIPMMKNKLLNSKEGYKEYVRTTSVLIPRPKKKL